MSALCQHLEMRQRAAPHRLGPILTMNDQLQHTTCSEDHHQYDDDAQGVCMVVVQQGAPMYWHLVTFAPSHLMCFDNGFAMLCAL